MSNNNNLNDNISNNINLNLNQTAPHDWMSMSE